jgi:hypothetical protein
MGCEGCLTVVATLAHELCWTLAAVRPPVVVRLTLGAVSHPLYGL